MALHSVLNDKPYKKACGLAIMPLRTNFNGPASQTKEKDIIDEAYELFRVNVLFKNYDIKGPADPVLIYLLVCLTQCFKLTENEKLVEGAKKRLQDVINEKVPRPREKGFFMSTMLEDIPQEYETYSSYTKQLKEETVVRFLEKFYVEGQQTDDYRLWAGLARKKFMGYSFTSGF